MEITKLEKMPEKVARSRNGSEPNPARLAVQELAVGDCICIQCEDGEEAKKAYMAIDSYQRRSPDKAYDKRKRGFCIYVERLR